MVLRQVLVTSMWLWQMLSAASSHPQIETSAPATIITNAPTSPVTQFNQGVLPGTGLPDSTDSAPVRSGINFPLGLLNFAAATATEDVSPTTTSNPTLATPLPFIPHRFGITDIPAISDPSIPLIGVPLHSTSSQGSQLVNRFGIPDVPAISDPSIPLTDIPLRSTSSQGSQLFNFVPVVMRPFTENSLPLLSPNITNTLDTNYDYLDVLVVANPATLEKNFNLFNVSPNFFDFDYILDEILNTTEAPISPNTHSNNIVDGVLNNTNSKVIPNTFASDIPNSISTPSQSDVFQMLKKLLDAMNNGPSLNTVLDPVTNIGVPLPDNKGVPLLAEQGIPFSTNENDPFSNKQGVALPDNKGVPFPKNNNDPFSNKQGVALPDNEGIPLPKNKNDPFSNNQGVAFPDNEGVPFPKNTNDRFSNKQGVALPDNEGVPFPKNVIDPFSNKQGVPLSDNEGVPFPVQQDVSLGGLSTPLPTISPIVPSIPPVGGNEILGVPIPNSALSIANPGVPLPSEIPNSNSGVPIPEIVDLGAPSSVRTLPDIPILPNLGVYEEVITQMFDSRLQNSSGPTIIIIGQPQAEGTTSTPKTETTGVPTKESQKVNKVGAPFVEFSNANFDGSSQLATPSIGPTFDRPFVEFPNTNFAGLSQLATPSIGPTFDRPVVEFPNANFAGSSQLATPSIGPTFGRTIDIPVVNTYNSYPTLHHSLPVSSPSYGSPVLHEPSYRLHEHSHYHGSPYRQYRIRVRRPSKKKAKGWDWNYYSKAIKGWFKKDDKKKSDKIIIIRQQPHYSPYPSSDTYGIQHPYPSSDSYGIPHSYPSSDSYGIPYSYHSSGLYQNHHSSPTSGSYGIQNSYSPSGSYGIQDSYKSPIYSLGQLSGSAVLSGSAALSGRSVLSSSPVLGNPTLNSPVGFGSPLGFNSPLGSIPFAGRLGIPVDSLEDLTDSLEITEGRGSSRGQGDGSSAGSGGNGGIGGGGSGNSGGIGG
ncbi:unnamed protein product, partial [Meganyctiphanes norvegica]